MKLLKFNTGLIEISRVMYLIIFLVFLIWDILNESNAHDHLLDVLSKSNADGPYYGYSQGWIMFIFYCRIQIPFLVIIFYTFIEQIIFLKKIPNIWFKILFLLSPLIFMLITLKKIV